MKLDYNLLLVANGKQIFSQIVLWCFLILQWAQRNWQRRGWRQKSIGGWDLFNNVVVMDVHFNHHSPYTSCGYFDATNSMKCQSPSSCLSKQDPSMVVTEPESKPRTKKLFFQHDELTNNDFSLISFPVSPRMLANENPCHVLCRCHLNPSIPLIATIKGGFPITQFN